MQPYFPLKNLGKKCALNLKKYNAVNAKNQTLDLCLILNTMFSSYEKLNSHLPPHPFLFTLPGRCVAQLRR